MYCFYGYSWAGITAASMGSKKSEILWFYYNKIYLHVHTDVPWHPFLPVRTRVYTLSQVAHHGLDRMSCTGLRNVLVSCDSLNYAAL